VVKNSKIKEWNLRLKCLEETIDYWMKNASQKSMEIIELFYDKK
jgi:hypothetical protein